MAVCWLRGLKSELVKDLCTVQEAVTKSPPKKTKHQNQKQTHQHKTKHSNTKQNRQTEAWQVPVHGLIHARDDNIVSSRHGMAAETKGRKSKSPGHTRRCVKQQKHHAETRDPPSQDPRDHMAQAVKA